MPANINIGDATDEDLPAIVAIYHSREIADLDGKRAGAKIGVRRIASHKPIS
jgi:hypothetical protein